MKHTLFTRTLLISAAVCGLSRPAAAQEPAFTPVPVTSLSRVDFDRAAEMTPQTPQQVSDWQAQLDAAKERRSSGRKMQFTGFAILMAGLVHNAIVMSDYSTCYPSYSCSHVSTAWIGLGMMVTGSAVGVVGGIKAHDADGEVNALIARGPGRMTALTLPVGDRGTLSIGLGHQVAVGYRVAW